MARLEHPGVDRKKLRRYLLGEELAFLLKLNKGAEYELNHDRDYRPLRDLFSEYNPPSPHPLLYQNID